MTCAPAARTARSSPPPEPLPADPFDLARFHAAQSGGVHERALAELRAGRKTGHWMWFVFPQLAGLGSSPTARHFALGGLAEARAYLADPVLATRLRECARALVELPAGMGVTTVLGEIDALKLRSSVTLFAAACDDDVFGELLRRFYGGEPDPRTLALLSP